MSVHGPGQGQSIQQAHDMMGVVAPPMSAQPASAAQIASQPLASPPTTAEIAQADKLASNYQSFFQAFRAMSFTNQLKLIFSGKSVLLSLGKLSSKKKESAIQELSTYAPQVQAELKKNLKELQAVNEQIRSEGRAHSHYLDKKRDALLAKCVSLMRASQLLPLQLQQTTQEATEGTYQEPTLPEDHAHGHVDLSPQPPTLHPGAADAQRHDPPAATMGPLINELNQHLGMDLPRITNSINEDQLMVRINVHLNRLTQPDSTFTTADVQRFVALLSSCPPNFLAKLNTNDRYQMFMKRALAPPVQAQSSAVQVDYAKLLAGKDGLETAKKKIAELKDKDYKADPSAGSDAAAFLGHLGSHPEFINGLSKAEKEVLMDLIYNKKHGLANEAVYESLQNQYYDLFSIEHVDYAKLLAGKNGLEFAKNKIAELKNKDYEADPAAGWDAAEFLRHLGSRPEFHKLSETEKEDIRDLIHNKLSYLAGVEKLQDQYNPLLGIVQI